MVVKLFTAILIFSLLVILRETYLLSKAMAVKEQFRITRTRLITLGVALSLALTFALTGFGV